MAVLDPVVSAVTALNTSMGNLTTQVNALVTAFQSAGANSVNPADVTNLANSVSALQSHVDALTASVTAVVSPPPASTPPAA